MRIARAMTRRTMNSISVIVSRNRAGVAMKKAIRINNMISAVIIAHVIYFRKRFPIFGDSAPRRLSESKDTAAIYLLSVYLSFYANLIDMPELPEIETITRVLSPELEGKEIVDAAVMTSSVIAHPSPELFIKSLIGERFATAERRGKFLILNLSSCRLIIHLRMTGSLVVVPSAFPVRKHTHLVLKLSDGNELRFRDVRRFGRLWLMQNGENDSWSGISRLGPEPFGDEFSPSYLSLRCSKSNRAIKEVLMNQSIVAGIGNIYSDEILFSSCINPLRKASSLNMEEWERLVATIKERLLFFIEKNGISLEDYQKSEGLEYRNTPYLQVYGKADEPCPVCGTKLSRCVIGGRSSVFCPHCQK